jgi:glycerophosphoryl diester phosphodiesterase
MTCPIRARAPGFKTRSRNKCKDGARPIIEGITLAMLVASIGFTGFFIFILLACASEWHAINLYIEFLGGVHFNYMLLTGIAWGASLVYLGRLLHRATKMHRKSGDASTITIERLLSPVEIVAWIVIVACWIVISSIFINIAGSVLLMIWRWCQATSTWWFAGIAGLLLFGLYWLAPAIARDVHGFKKKPFVKRARIIAVTGTIFACYAIALALPLLIPSPGVTGLSLPPKPQIIAHRGASHYAPENTLVAGEAAVALGAVGWEIDVQVSRDGVYFLLHDDDLRRTTDVELQFPSRAADLACNFTYAEISQLDAGSWFADDDPFFTIATAIVNRSDADAYKGARVPTLQEAITFSEIHGLILDVDMKRPPASHPFHDSFKTGVIALLAASSLGKKAWMYTSSVDAVNLTRTCSSACSVENVVAKGYELVNTGVNVDDGLLAAYQQAGIPVVVYTIDDTLAFSALWVRGVTYVKSNRPWIFTSLATPVGAMSAVDHATCWMVFYLVSVLALATALLVKQHALMGKRERTGSGKGSVQND